MSPSWLLRVAYVSLFVALYLSLSWADYWWGREVSVYFCTVGQGDAALIQYRSTQLLIDTGPPGISARECLERYVPLWDRNIELVLLTHADSDHSGGLSTILERFDVEMIIMSPIQNKTDDFDELYELIQRYERSSGTVALPSHDQSIQFCAQCRLKILVPREEEQLFRAQNQLTTETIISDTNALSVASLLEVYNTKILFMADRDGESELALIQAGLIVDIDILKIAHHGSKFGTSTKFLDRTTPEHTIISSGQNNPYGHPHPETLARITESGAQIWHTKGIKSIQIDTTAQGYQVRQDPNPQ